MGMQSVYGILNRQRNTVVRGWEGILAQHPIYAQLWPTNFLSLKKLIWKVGALSPTL